MFENGRTLLTALRILSLVARLAAPAATGVLAGEAHAYNPVKTCGGNLFCRIVDVLDRDFWGNTIFSSEKVSEAWLTLRRLGCSEVSDVVVGGTFGENGAPDKKVPAGFAEHLQDRCTLVVHYELEAPVVDAQAYEDSVEHGRRALTVVLNKLDALESGRLRVWGHSKGAAIVESIWRVEARDGNTKFIARINGTDRYLDPCPSNRCYYFGFGYPRGRELESKFSLSRVTAALWNTNSDGFMEKPDIDEPRWWRLTTFTNLSDPIFECTWNCLGVILDPCHRYESFLRSHEYEYFDSWNDYTSSSVHPNPRYLGDECGA